MLKSFFILLFDCPFLRREKFSTLKMQRYVSQRVYFVNIVIASSTRFAQAATENQIRSRALGIRWISESLLRLPENGNRLAASFCYNLFPPLSLNFLPLDSPFSLLLVSHENSRHYLSAFLQLSIQCRCKHFVKTPWNWMWNCRNLCDAIHCITKRPARLRRHN